MNLSPTRPAVMRGLASVSALAILVGLAGCSAPADAPSGTTGADSGDCQVRALLVANVTGAGSANGESAKRAQELAAQYINDNGGVNGCELVVDVKDNGSDYSKSLPLTQEALAEKDYFVVNAADYGGASVAPLLTREGILGVWSNGTGGLFSAETTPTIFDACTPLAGATLVMANYLADEGYKKIGLVTDNTAVGSSIVEIAKANAASAGVEVVSEQIDLNSVDMTPVVQRLQASAPDVILVDLFGAAAGYFFSALSASGWDVPKYGSFTTFATDLGSLIPEEQFAGLISGGPASATAPSVTEGVDTLMEGLLANGGTIDHALLLYAQNYDALIIAAWAANQTGSLDGATLAAFLQENGDVEVPGLTQAKATGYSADNHEWHPKNGLGIAYQDKLVDGRYQNRVALVDA